MTDLHAKLAGLREAVERQEPIRIAIFGFGSVGAYLADYLLTQSEFRVELYIGVRSAARSSADVNVLRVAKLIRQGLTHRVSVHEVDLNNVSEIVSLLGRLRPHFVVNASRVYTGVKYGSISWESIRAYGLWTPLAIRFIRNLMVAHSRVASTSIVINTSYSDVTNAWLKSSGIKSPDFGSGNLNHLVPRIKIAASRQMRDLDPTEIGVTLATSHFHDVVISKEGHCEGEYPLLVVEAAGKPGDIDVDALYSHCAIDMPVGTKRNMMNASSNFEIISQIISSIQHDASAVLHSPGFAGLVGGYPVRVSAQSAGGLVQIGVIEDYFSLSQMKEHNQRSIALDGVEKISAGEVVFTEDLITKTMSSFGVTIPSRVALDDADKVADHLIASVIRPVVSA